MAKHETLGYCPNNEFLNPSIRQFKESTIASMVRETLGHISAYMVYEKDSFDPKGCYITEALLVTETLGLKIASALKCYIPVCNYPEGDTIVWIQDCINPGKVIGSVRFEDEKFVVGIANFEHITHIKLYKK